MSFTASSTTHDSDSVRHDVARGTGAGRGGGRRARRAYATALGTAAAGLMIALAGCGTSSTGQVATPTGSPRPSTPARTQAPSASARIGGQCDQIPSVSDLRGMSTSQMMKTLAKDPQLSAYAAAVSSVAANAVLRPKQDYTLFVPSNAAFASVPADQLAKLHTSRQLTRTLKYHIVSGRLVPGQFTAGASPKSLEGARLSLTQHNSAYKVNDATVLCGNIRAATVTVYIINKILWPPG